MVLLVQHLEKDTGAAIQFIQHIHQQRFPGIAAKQAFVRLAVTESAKRLSDSKKTLLFGTLKSGRTAEKLESLLSIKKKTYKENQSVVFQFYSFITTDGKKLFIVTLLFSLQEICFYKNSGKTSAGLLQSKRVSIFNKTMHLT
ncbi:hypothetical protein FNJ61_12100 [Bacteroides pyogenes]|nr:hypothetical protein FNJ61_12100 [Bacteroides pyogenes]